VQRDHRVHFLLAAQHAALELEVGKAVALARRARQAHHGLGRLRFLVAQAEPGVVGIRFAPDTPAAVFLRSPTKNR